MNGLVSVISVYDGVKLVRCWKGQGSSSKKFLLVKVGGRRREREGS